MERGMERAMEREPAELVAAEVDAVHEIRSEGASAQVTADRVHRVGGGTFEDVLSEEVADCEDEDEDEDEDEESRESTSSSLLSSLFGRTEEHTSIHIWGSTSHEDESNCHARESID